MKESNSAKSHRVKTRIFLIATFILLFGEVQADAILSGDVLWGKRYNGPGNDGDEAQAIAIDSNNNVYVAGTSNGLGCNFALVKYGPAGRRKWVRRYVGPGKDDTVKAIAIDSKNNVYIAGQSDGGSTGWDYAVVKYDPTGNRKWVRRYSGTGNSWDSANAIAIDSNNNIYLAGHSETASNGWDFTVIKYDSAGNKKWVKRYNGAGSGDDWASGLAVDSNDNVYAAGQTNGGSTVDDFTLIKYDVNGDRKWIRRYDGPGNGYDNVNGIAIDSKNNIYLTGRSYANNTYDDFATVKYDPNGKRKWVRRLNGPRNFFDGAYDIAIDKNDNVYVSGTIDGQSVFGNFGVVKYDAAGNQKWTNSYNGPGNNDDLAKSVAVDSYDNIYVAGNSYGSDSSSDFTVIKYGSNGKRKWVKPYNGPGNGDDFATSIAIDENNNVYVTGSADGGSSGSDFETIKYAL